MVSFWDRLFNRVHKCKYYDVVSDTYRTIASNCKIYEEGGRWYTSYPSLNDIKELLPEVNNKLYLLCISIVKQRFTRPYYTYMPDTLEHFIWMLEDNPKSAEFYGLQV
jgi:hypothetical protein